MMVWTMRCGGVLALWLASGCVCRHKVFTVTDAPPSAADGAAVTASAPEGDCRNDAVQVASAQHRHGRWFGRAHDEVRLEVTNTGDVPLYVALSAEVRQPTGRWWTQPNGLFVPPGVTKRISAKEERTEGRTFTGVARWNAAPARDGCGQWRYVEMKKQP